MWPRSRGIATWSASPERAVWGVELVFKRRTPRTYFEVVTESLYPRGGWRRASRYVAYRLRRLPDPAHKISRGIAVGVFTSFTPLFGLHFILAAAIAWIIRGNVVAALLATFVGNPLTFPLIAAVSMELGSIILNERVLPLPLVLPSFSDAAGDLWRNFMAIFTNEPTRWVGLRVFFDRVFLPYLVGGLAPGLAAAIAAYFFANPLIAAYQKARDARRKKRFAKKRERIISRRIEAEKAEVISKRQA
ncbi:MAG: DUF2062 domain-containing protein, partial [Pseudomonadota bacterium]